MAAFLFDAREVVASAARTSSGNSGKLFVPVASEVLVLLVDVTAVSGTSPTLDVSVEWTPDEGTTFHVAEPADAFAQITAVKKVCKLFSVKAPGYRIVWAVGGTSPSFTFAVDEFAR